MPQVVTGTSGAAAVAPSVARQRVNDYIALTKPKVQSLLLFTTLAAMLIAGQPSIALIIATLIGGAMSAGGSGAINHWYDRDVDLLMDRTADRPVASGRVSPRAALSFGVTRPAGSGAIAAAAAAES